MHNSNFLTEPPPPLPSGEATFGAKNKKEVEATKEYELLLEDHVEFIAQGQGGTQALGGGEAVEAGTARPTDPQPIVVALCVCQQFQ